MKVIHLDEGEAQILLESCEIGVELLDRIEQLVGDTPAWYRKGEAFARTAAILKAQGIERPPREE